jgi:peptidoglycan/LPS O-acetylase OafA/YrhL
MSGINGRIPSLDGLRAVSILMVLYGHLQGTRGFPALNLHWWLGDVAHLGVIVFFVISGFLITSLLMQERQASGTVSLRKFYLRRTLRIFPAFYAFIFAMVVASHWGWVRMTATDLFYSLTYTMNYYPARSWTVGHLWSLSVEEQFYLLWPAVFLLLGERRALAAAMLAFVGGPVVRMAMRLVFASHSPWRDLEIFPALADNIAIGCVLALLRPNLIIQPWYLRMTSSLWLFLVIPLIFSINRLLGYAAADLFGSPIMLIGIAVLIEATTRPGASLTVRLLNWKPVVFVGTLSYSLYLWQQPFLDRHRDTPLSAFPQNILLALVAAVLSYYLIESAFIRMRKRWEPSAARRQASSADCARPIE